MHMTNADTDNRACPDWQSHYENATDRLYPGIVILTADQDAEVSAEAEAEYQVCEGH